MTRVARKSHTAEFRAVWLASGLTKQQVAELVGVALCTVVSWTKAPTSKSAIPAPKWALELLTAKLAIRKHEDQPTNR